MDRPSPLDQRRSAEVLINSVRDQVPDGAATYLGRLDAADPMATVEAYLYVRQRRLELPAWLYRSLRDQALAILGVEVPDGPTGSAPMDPVVTDQGPW